MDFDNLFSVSESPGSAYPPLWDVILTGIQVPLAASNRNFKIVKCTWMSNSSSYHQLAFQQPSKITVIINNLTQ